MTYELTNDEKRNIINQHLRNLKYSQYGIEISIVEENAAVTPDQENLSTLNGQLANINGKMDVLVAELATIVD
jgi:hypothetical protein